MIDVLAMRPGYRKDQRSVGADQVLEILVASSPEPLKVYHFAVLTGRFSRPEARCRESQRSRPSSSMGTDRGPQAPRMPDLDGSFRTQASQRTIGMKKATPLRTPRAQRAFRRAGGESPIVRNLTCLPNNAETTEKSGRTNNPCRRCSTQFGGHSKGESVERRYVSGGEASTAAFRERRVPGVSGPNGNCCEISAPLSDRC